MVCKHSTLTTPHLRFSGDVWFYYGNNEVLVNDSLWLMDLGPGGGPAIGLLLKYHFLFQPVYSV